jgi:hypothetical protein
MSLMDKEMGARILLLFWRAWHLRDRVWDYHCSSKFLVNYIDSLRNMSQGLHERGMEKGKGKVQHDSCNGWNPTEDSREGARAGKEWTPPPPGWVKLNIDVAFCHNTGESSARIIIRDEAS